MLPRFKSLGVLTLMVACCLVGLAVDVNAQTKMDTPKQGWAQVPGGTVWLNPGEAYEHSTGLVRDRNGVKRYPTTPQSLQQQPQYYAPQPAPVFAPAVPTYQPFVQPSPYLQPQPLVQPSPYFAPQPYVQPTPYYAPYFTPQVDYGPYVPPGCWNCPNAGRAPSTQSWGVRGNPMDQPKTGDAPRLGEVPRGGEPSSVMDTPRSESAAE